MRWRSLFYWLLHLIMWRRGKFLRKINEFLLNFAAQHLRFLPPHGVKEDVVQSPPPHKVEEKKISLQNYWIFAEFRGATLAISSTLRGGGNCFSSSSTSQGGGHFNTPVPCEVEQLVNRLLHFIKWKRQKFLRKITEFLLNFAPQHSRLPPPHEVQKVFLAAFPAHKVEAILILLYAVRWRSLFTGSSTPKNKVAFIFTELVITGCINPQNPQNPQNIQNLLKQSKLTNILKTQHSIRWRQFNTTPPP